MAVTRCREWLQQKLRSSGKPLPFSLASLEAKNKQSAETAIIRSVQESHFKQETSTVVLKSRKSCSCNEEFLEPFHDNEGLLCIRGRLKN